MSGWGQGDGEGSECITSGRQTDLRRAAGVDGHTAASVSGRRYRTEDHHSITNNGQTKKKQTSFLLSLFFSCMCQIYNILLKEKETSQPVSLYLDRIYTKTYVLVKNNTFY